MILSRKKKNLCVKLCKTYNFIFHIPNTLMSIIFTEDTNNLLAHEAPLIVAILRLNILKILCFDQQYQQTELSFYIKSITLAKIKL